MNLGRHFSLPKGKWPQLCVRIESLLSGQKELMAEPVTADIESLAQRYAARLIAAVKPIAGANEGKVGAVTPDYQEVDINSIEQIRPRSVGVEHVALSALSELGLPKILESVGLNGIERNCAMGSIIGRMASPGSELATWRWLREQSAVSELLDVDFDGLSLMRLYRVSDTLVRHREEIEKQLFNQIEDLFSLPATVTLYDLTNTYFEGEMAGNDKAKRGKSKEKRTDCPLVTLGLVLDGSGFVRRSRMFEGNVSEASTLEGMLTSLDAPKGAIVIMDRGIATDANVSWLIEHGYRYLVVSRERERQFDLEQAVETATSSEQVVRLQKVISEDGTEVRLYCHSEERELKESAMSNRFSERFEKGLADLAAGLAKPRCEKKITKLWERIGGLKKQCHGIGQHYTIDIVPDDTGDKAVSLTWEKTPVSGTRLTHPGVYCLRTNELTMDEATLWHTYSMLTDLESVFRCLKSELGMRPVFHHKEERAEGHLFITVLAYQAVQVIRRKLKEKGINTGWAGLREILSVQQRVTASFTQRDGRALHVRKATVAEEKLKKIYDVLRISAEPGGVKKMVYG